MPDGIGDLPPIVPARLSADGGLTWASGINFTNGQLQVTAESEIIMVTASTNDMWTNQIWGSVTVEIPAGQAKLIAQPWQQPDYTLFAAFSVCVTNSDIGLWAGGYLPHHTVMALWDGDAGTWRPQVWDWAANAWHPTNDVLFLPGQGGILINSDTNAVAVEFSGVAFRGTYTNTMPAGWSVVSHINAKAGYLDELGFPYDTNTIVRRWIGDAWREYRPTNTVSSPPAPGQTAWGNDREDQPYLNPAEAIFVYQATAKQWIQHGIRIPPETPPPDYGTNLWLSLDAMDATNVWLTAHNCTVSNWYCLESRQSLSGGWWGRELQPVQATNTVNPMPPVNRNGRGTLFFRLNTECGP